ncbi:hydrolase [Marivirga lumbricoides]|uniref:Hydrolase n=1 Tax=Marivirga lumbricoides TaxID=1046115 RepID=A0ABQ1M445_9BACT|nr:hydrolase [Marivirga lumbricoides]
MIDSHCHIDLYPNPLEIVKESEILGIITIGMTNLPSHFKMGQPHLKGYKKTRLALGMHPLMAENHSEEFPIFHECFNKTSYIGEVGLDFSREGIKTKDQQIDSFKKILEAVGDKPKILSIHSRRAEKEVLKLLKDYQIRNAIFHWYSGGLKLIDQIVDSGYFLSVNPAMIRSESGKKIIQRIPKEFILTESDGPFIDINNQPVKPKDIETVLTHLSTIYNCRVSEVNNLIVSNFKKLVNQIKHESTTGYKRH